MIDTKNTIISFDYEGPEINEITRNLLTLYGTPEGSIPLDRNFGISQDFLSYPLPTAQNLLALELAEKTEEYEPRVEVKEVTYSYGDDGSLIPKVLITKAENETEGDEV